MTARESAERIIELARGPESKHLYTAKEVTAIELTVAVTVLTDGFVSDEVYIRAQWIHRDPLAYLIGGSSR